MRHESHPALHLPHQKAIAHLCRRFNADPAFQRKLHLYATYYWLLNFPVIGYLFFFQPHAWVAVGLLVNTFYSLYANFATDYSGVSAADAADRAHRERS